MPIAHLQFMKLSSLCDRLAPYPSCLGIDTACAGEFISVFFCGWNLFCDFDVLHLIVVTLRQWCLDRHKEVIEHTHT